MKNSDTRILYDGWAFVRQPNQPAALHLIELLNHCPEEFTPVLALPGEPAEQGIVPARVQQVAMPIEDTPAGRLRWEQRLLADAAKKTQASLVHLTTTTPALWGEPLVVISPAGPTVNVIRRGGSLPARIREALSKGAEHRTQAVFWPDDMPEPAVAAPVWRLPAVFSPDFNPVDPPDAAFQTALEMPETYLLYHGPQEPWHLERLVAVWSWAAGSIGELFPLVILGFGAGEQAQRLASLARQHRLERFIKILPDVPIAAVASIYRGSAGLLHFGDVAAWGGAVRYALACGKPVVADETARADALVGSAGYLFPHQEARRMGAALLTIVVNEDVAQGLHAAACAQAAHWQPASFSQQLGAAYRQILKE
jgi:glycosyltransferase involved in cell wall biosynthesis